MKILKSDFLLKLLLPMKIVNSLQLWFASDLSLKGLHAGSLVPNVMVGRKPGTFMSWGPSRRLLGQGTSPSGRINALSWECVMSLETAIITKRARLSHSQLKYGIGSSLGAICHPHMCPCHGMPSAMPWCSMKPSPDVIAWDWTSKPLSW